MKKFLFSFLFVLMLAVIASAQFVVNPFRYVVTGGGGGDVAVVRDQGYEYADLYEDQFTLTSFNASGGNFLVLIIAVSFGDNPTTVTFNGDSMTSVATLTTSGHVDFEMFVLSSPDQVTGNFLVTHPADGNYANISAVLLSNVDVSGTPYGTVVTDSPLFGASTSVSGVVGETGGLILYGCAAQRGNGSTALTPTAGQTSIHNNLQGSDSSAYSIIDVSTEPGGASVAGGCSVTGGDTNLDLIAIPINKA